MGKKKTQRKKDIRAEKARTRAVAKAEATRKAQAEADKVRAWGNKAAAAVAANKQAVQRAASWNEAKVAAGHGNITGGGGSDGATNGGRSKSPAPAGRPPPRLSAYPSNASLGVDESRQDRIALLVALLCIVCAGVWAHLTGQLVPHVIVDEASGLRVFDTPAPKLWYGADWADEPDEDPGPSVVADAGTAGEATGASGGARKEL